MHKKLLAAKLVMGQLASDAIVSAARHAKAAGETGEALDALAALDDGAEPNVATALLRDWLRQADVPLPSPQDAVNTLFDYHFAALVLGPRDPSAGVAEFMKNVVFARPVSLDASESERRNGPTSEDR